MAVAGGFLILFPTSQKYLNAAKCSSFLFWHKLMAKYILNFRACLWYDPFSFQLIFMLFLHRFHSCA